MISRRGILLGTAALPLKAARMPIIDTHIHLFDPTRPQGVPWPPKDSPIYQPALPDRYRAFTAPFGIAHAIEIECSPWLEDNQWVLDLIAKDDFVLGTIGNLEPGKPGFAKNLERFHRNPRFLGIRIGNLWDRGISGEAIVQDLKVFAQTGLTLDTANPDRALVESVIRLKNRVPSLRIVMDHIPQMNPEGAPLAELARLPDVYCKISQVLRHVDNRVPLDLPFYRARLDTVFQLFGEDHVLFGSDWPNSELWAPYSEVFHLAQTYFATKSQEVQKKYFFRNAALAYRAAISAAPR